MTGHQTAPFPRSTRPKSKKVTKVQVTGMGTLGGDALRYTLEIIKGLINGRRTSVFRDKGPTINMVRSSLVEPESRTGRTLHVQYPDGTGKDMEEVSVLVDTPYIKGKIKAALNRKADYGLLITNYPCVEDQVGLSCGNDPEETGTGRMSPLVLTPSASQLVEQRPLLPKQKKRKIALFFFYLMHLIFRQFLISQKTEMSPVRRMWPRSADPATTYRPARPARVNPTQENKRLVDVSSGEAKVAVVPTDEVDTLYQSFRLMEDRSAKQTVSERLKNEQVSDPVLSEGRGLTADEETSAQTPQSVEQPGLRVTDRQEERPCQLKVVTVC